MSLFFRRGKNQESTPPAIDYAAIDAQIALGHQAEDSGDAESARAIYERAIHAAPEYWRGFLNLGNALRLLGRHEEAAERYRRSIALNPEFPGAHLNLGNVLIACDQFSAAAESYQTAARLKPEWAEAWFGLGCAFDRVPLPRDATGAYRRALQLDPRHAMAAANLARALTREGIDAEAREILTDLLQRLPGDVHALLALAELSKQAGDPGAAVAAYRAALAARPEDRDIHSSYLFALNFLCEADADALLAEHRAFGDSLLRSVPSAHWNTALNAGKRLKIGYISADFRRHSVSCFVDALLQHHDRGEVDVFCYYNHDTRDDITDRFERLSDHWRDIASESDDRVMQRIVDDGIDILIDLSGHTTGNRLPVFARKPAPVQFTWLGYLCTTGLEAIDWRICDAHTDPLGVAERWQVERPARLPDSQWCYRPQVILPKVSALPMLRNGYCTFGSFNQASKLNAPLLRTWAQVLAQIPHSRLRIVGVESEILRDTVRRVFQACAIAEERVELLGRIPIDAYFSSYQDVDIALDSFPYNGATTTFDALIMGVPVATVSGERAISRGGSSLLSTIGMSDWIAPSAEGLPALLERQSHDADRLSVLRDNLPARLRDSALMDGRLFARNVEKLLRGAWHERCAR